MYSYTRTDVYLGTNRDVLCADYCILKKIKISLADSTQARNILSERSHEIQNFYRHYMLTNHFLREKNTSNG